VPLASGSRLGPYDILSPLGAGGFGEVYKARDTRLDRTVAIKILPSADPELKARFEREAKAIAALTHPHICTLYDVGHQDGTDYLVMEYLEGETLDKKIARGPVKIDDALKIGIEISEALDKAHRAGIVHRDLKPANVMLTKSGVKLLDFGLAKLKSRSLTVTGFSVAATQATSPVTSQGTILGTLHYMSPEQIEGREADPRSDIFAFGCLLYQMASAKLPFNGPSPTSVMAAILEREPPTISSLHIRTPRSLDHVLSRCLAKDPDQRWQSALDLKAELEWIIESGTVATPFSAPGHSPWREWTGWIAAVLLLGAALFFAALFFGARPSSPSWSGDPISVPVFPPEKTAFSALGNTTVNVPSFALSPDGHTLVFVAEAPGARPMLWLRSMDRVDARQLAGTEGAQDPMWSPDSRWIAFDADGKLKKIPAAGGAVQIITQTGADFRGGTWGPEDTILFGMGAGPILRVDSAGGTPTTVTTIDTSRQEGSHRHPQMLPDGHHFLYAIWAGGQSGVFAASLDDKTKKLLVRGYTTAVYASPGYLLFVDGDTLLGQIFDAKRLELKGQPFLVAEHVGRNTGLMSAVSASRAGNIAYADTISQNGRLAWIDRRGNLLGSPGTPDGDYTDFRLSPDDKRLAASLVNPRTNIVEIWVTELARNSNSRVASGGLVTAAALWSPDGTRLMFRSNRNGILELYQRSAAGGGNDRLMLSGETYLAAHMQSTNLVPSDWSPDGRNIIFSVPAPESGTDLWLLPLGEEGKDAGKPVPFITSPADKLHGTFSPSGRLVAYTSNESGRFEVYVETVPRSDRKWSVSTSGGYEPRWRADEREIYYLSEDRKLMAVPVGAGPSFGVPEPLFQTRVAHGVGTNRMHFVPSRDGQRFLVNMATETVTSPITVVFNWTAALKK
jgi:serine/threonine protein kinase/Tol biopolymer transport system component